ncbi:MAG: AmmeMemoRadiSam system radical SAM enzyme [bacterium]|nr:AmmeMemoRadiSam system radical SAM enzyme [bacterium]
MKKALLYEKAGDVVTCLLCAHTCKIKKGKLGLCRVRKNIAGELYALNYDKIAATHADPIEKKPLYHFLPASTSFSVAAMGCNFSCSFCQNNSLSEVTGENSIHGQKVTPEQIVATALRYGSQSISYTYSEPTIYFELMLETAKLAKAEGIKNVMVSNGHMSAKAFEMIAPYLDAANIDLKSFSDEFYRDFCVGKRDAVMDTIRRMKEYGVWVEVTTLLITGLNTGEKELEGLIAFLLEVDAGMPWHVSRFFPQHRLVDRGPTPVKEIFRVLDRAENMGIKFLYAGNVQDNRFSDTKCPSCNSLLIERSGYSTIIRHLADGKCDSCNLAIPGVW